MMSQHGNLFGSWQSHAPYINLKICTWLYFAMVSFLDLNNLALLYGTFFGRAPVLGHFLQQRTSPRAFPPAEDQSQGISSGRAPVLGHFLQQSTSPREFPLGEHQSQGIFSSIVPVLGHFLWWRTCVQGTRVGFVQFLTCTRKLAVYFTFYLFKQLQYINSH